jgi:hypothetical protein
LKPFAETNRSLKTDNFYPSLVGMVLIILVLIGWGGWFLSPVIPIYQSSRQVIASADGYVTATFSPQAAAKIHYKQEAYLYLQGSQASAPILLVVTDVDQETGQVDLVIQNKAGFAQLSGSFAINHLDVLIAYNSPIYLVLQAAGLSSAE